MKWIQLLAVPGEKIEQLFYIKTPPSYCKKEFVDSIVKKQVKSIFDRFWLDEVKKVKEDITGLFHSKLRLHSTIKSSFSQEPNIVLVQSRNQR